MRPILIFAFAAIAASAVGVGALGNVIELTVQQFGVGSADIETPIKAANIDFEMEAIPVVIPADDCLDEDNEPIPECIPTEERTVAYKNMITGCSFHSWEFIDSVSDEENESNPVVVCKLSDAEGAIIAEGSLELVGGYEGSTREIIPIDNPAFPGANDFTNVHDVHLVVFGSNPTLPPQPSPEDPQDP